MPKTDVSTLSIQQALDRGVEFHTSGQFKEAQAIYRQVLQRDPHQPVALNLMGMIATQSGHHDIAIDLLTHAITVEPAYSVAYCNLGNVYKDMQDLGQAEQAYQKALQIQPDYATAHFNLATTFVASQKPGQAETSFQNAIAANPKYEKSYSGLADLYMSQGRRKAAAVHYRNAVACNPDNPDALVNLGVAISKLGDLSEAVQCYQKAIDLQPDLKEAHNNLGKIYRDAGQLDDALKCYRQALAVSPAYLSALINIMIVLRELGNTTEAMELCQRTLTLYPENANAHVNHGNLLMDNTQLGQALAGFDEALRLNPGHDDALSGRGVALKELGRFDDAIESFEKSLKINPENKVAEHNLSLVLLMEGDYARGWELYENRWRKNPKNQGWRTFPQALWDGSDLSGKTILVWGEQGIGDEIVYASLYKKLMDQGARCFFECHPRLVPLFQRSFPNARIVARAPDPDPQLLASDIDFQCPAASLMRWLLTSMEGGHEREGYLLADGLLTTKLKNQYRTDENQKVIGLGWRTSHAKMKSNYDIPLNLFDPLLEIPGINFVSLQYGDHQAELDASLARTQAPLLQDPDINPLKNMDQFAAQVASMDLVISIVNSTAVIASGLGVPVWGVVPRVSEWRWGNDAKQCLWYPSMPLFRQPMRGDWDAVIESLVPALEGWVQQK